MNKLIGYLIAIVGLVLLVLTFNMNKFKIALPQIVKPAYILIIGIVLVILGVVLSMNKEKFKKIPQAEEEVPIYEGEGKKRKIIAYRKEGK